MIHEWKTVSACFTTTMGKRCYGKRRLANGRIIWVNYGRELKNGKGLTLMDRLKENIVGAENAMFKHLSENLYAERNPG